MQTFGLVIGAIAGLVTVLGGLRSLASWWSKRRRRYAHPLARSAESLTAQMAIFDDLAALNERVFPDGTAIREKADERVYIIVGGAKIWLPGPAWYERFGEPAITVLPAGFLTSIPDLPRNGTLVREWSDRTVYLIENGHRSLVPPETSRDELDMAAVHVVPDGSLANIPRTSSAGASKDHLVPYAGATPDELRYEQVSIETYTDSSMARPSDSTALRPGEKARVVIRLRNSGSLPWKADGAAPIRLGTWNPQDHYSGFYVSGWISLNRPAGPLEREVPPGSVGTFEFPIAAPAEPGDWVEYLNLLAENWVWAAAGTGITLRVTVSASDT